MVNLEISSTRTACFPHVGIADKITIFLVVTCISLLFPLSLFLLSTIVFPFPILSPSKSYPLCTLILPLSLDSLPSTYSFLLSFLRTPINISLLLSSFAAFSCSSVCYFIFSPDTSRKTVIRLTCIRTLRDLVCQLVDQSM